MNQEQVKSAVRWIIATFGPYITAHGYASSSTLEIVGGIIVSIAPFVWAMFTHTQTNAVAVVDAIAKDPASPVKGVIVTNTIEGRDLAKDMPGTTTVVAGTGDAKVIAATGATS